MSQGVLGWRVAEPEKLAERIDFTLDLRQRHPCRASPSSRSRPGWPASSIRQRSIIWQAASVRELLDAGIEPLRQRLEQALANEAALAELGVAIVSVRLSNLAPSSELERALQTPTFESLQQKADEGHVRTSGAGGRQGTRHRRERAGK